MTSRFSVALIAGSAALLGTARLPQDIGELNPPFKPLPAPSTQATRDQLRLSDLAENLFALDLEQGDATLNDVAAARLKVQSVIDLSRNALEDIPPNGTLEQKIRAIHSVVHDQLGWGSSNNPGAGYARQIANQQPDCDVFSLIYHEIGAALGMPFQIVITGRLDGKNHAFVTYGAGDEFRAIETRADPKNGTQIIHRSEFSLIYQYEQANGLKPFSTPIYRAGKVELIGTSVWERESKKTVQGVEISRLIQAGLGLSADEAAKQTGSTRELIQRALDSGKLSPKEAIQLKRLFGDLETLAAKIRPVWPECPMVLDWFKGAKSAQAHYEKSSADILTRGRAAVAHHLQVTKQVDEYNALLREHNYPFLTRLGQRDGEGQIVDPYAIVIDAIASRVSVSFPEVTEIKLDRLPGGERSLAITYSEAGKVEKGIFTESGKTKKERK